MEAWGGSAKNAIIFTEPDFDHLHALAPYQPLSMKVGVASGRSEHYFVGGVYFPAQAFYFPIDPRLNFFVANKLLKELAVSERLALV
jgi:integrator complex subunit 9